MYGSKSVLNFGLMTHSQKICIAYITYFMFNSAVPKQGLNMYI